MISISLRSRIEPIVMLLGRWLVAVIFIHEGYVKIVSYSAATAYARAFGLPELLPLAIITELGFGFLIVVGLFTRFAAFGLAGFCLFTALVFHTKFGDINQLLHFEKNLAMAGGLLFLMMSGPGKFSIDQWVKW